MYRGSKRFILSIFCVFLPCGCNLSTNSTPSAEDFPSDIPETPIPSSKPSPEQVWIDKKLSTMSTEEKVGQLFFVRHSEQTAADVTACHLGGVLLFGRDFKDKTFEEVCAMTQSLQSAADIPLLIGADEEGGTVVRASSNPNLRSKKFAAPQRVYQKGGLDALAADAREKSAFLLSLGINVNLAPVCDLSADPADYIYPRTLGLSASETAEGISSIVGVMQEEHIGSVLKHFPGYGGNVDTHTGTAVDTRPYDTFLKNDFLPFRAGIEAGADSVLVSHNIVQCMDETRPASLSAPVHEVLRKELGFEGVIMTDDLVMDDLAAYCTDDTQGSVAVLAVQAGNDMLITTDYQSQIAAIIAAVEKGTLPEERLNASVARILQWKIDLGLIEVPQ